MTRRPVVVAWLARVLMAFGATVLLLWFVAPGVLVPSLLGSTPTKPAAAASFLLLGVALASPSAAWRRRLALALVAVIALLVIGAAVTGHASVFATSLNLDRWRAESAADSGSPAVGTAVGLLAAAAGIAIAARSGRWATALAALVFADGYVALVGHLYGASDLYRLQSATDMAVATAVALLGAAIAVAVCQPGLPLMRALSGPNIAGVLVRRSLPWALLLPPLVGWLHLTGVRHGWFGGSFGVALMVLAYAASTVVAVFLGARTATRVDRQRQHVTAALAALNEELADRVEAGVAESRADRERLSFLLDRSPVGIFETGPDGARRYVNDRWREITGVAGSAADGTWSEGLHPDDRERVGQEWSDAVATGREYTSRYRYLRPEGGVRWVDTTCRVLNDPSGRVTGWLGSVTDVTAQVESQESLAESERRHRSIVSALAEGIVLHGPDGRVTDANAAASAVLGVTKEQLLGRSISEVVGLPVHEDGAAFLPDELPVGRAVRTAVASRDLTMGVTRPDGSLAWLRVNVVPVGGDLPSGVVTTFVDVTDQLQSQAALRRSEEHFRLAMRHAPIGMAMVSLAGRFMETNEAMANITGYAKEELLGKTFQQITHPDDLGADEDQVRRLLEGSISHYQMEKRYLRRAGDIVWGLLSVSLVRDDDGSPAYFISQVQDISDARAAQERLVHRALHDPLTGLANRELIHDRLELAIARATRTGNGVAVLFCDLDHFKHVNDTHGHEVGDAVLRAVAERLRRSVRPADTVGRLGGDEFVIVVEDVHDDRHVLEIAGRIHDELSRPVRVVGGLSLAIRVSIGAAHGRGRDARAMLREADEAMYRAKAAGRDRLELFHSGAGLSSHEVT